MKNYILAFLFFSIGMGAHFLMSRRQSAQLDHPELSEASTAAESPVMEETGTDRELIYHRMEQLTRELEKLRTENTELKKTLVGMQSRPVASGDEDTGRNVKEFPSPQPKEAARPATAETAIRKEFGLDQVFTPAQAEDFLTSVRLENAFPAIARSTVVTRIDAKLASLMGSYEGPVQVKDSSGVYRMKLDIQLQEAGNDALSGRFNLIVFQDDREIIGHRSAKNIDRVRRVDGSEASWLYFDKNVIQLYKLPQSDFVGINWYRTGSPTEYRFHGSGHLMPAS
jgi:hypothetical protein